MFPVNVLISTCKPWFNIQTNIASFTAKRNQLLFKRTQWLCCSENGTPALNGRAAESVQCLCHPRLPGKQPRMLVSQRNGNLLPKFLNRQVRDSSSGLNKTEPSAAIPAIGCPKFAPAPALVQAIVSAKVTKRGVKRGSICCATRFVLSDLRSPILILFGLPFMEEPTKNTPKSLRRPSTIPKFTFACRVNQNTRLRTNYELSTKIPYSKQQNKKHNEKLKQVQCHTEQICTANKDI